MCSPITSSLTAQRPLPEINAPQAPDRKRIKTRHIDICGDMDSDKVLYIGRRLSKDSYKAAPGIPTRLRRQHPLYEGQAKKFGNGSVRADFACEVIRKENDS